MKMIMTMMKMMMKMMMRKYDSCQNLLISIVMKKYLQLIMTQVQIHKWLDLHKDLYIHQEKNNHLYWK